MQQFSTRVPDRTVGMDLSDRMSQLYVVDAAGTCVDEGRVRTAAVALQRWFGSRPPMRVVLEVGTHSPWVSRVLADCGHEVLVANPRKLRLIYQSDRKTDRLDAAALARVGRLDPQLLAPIRHRGAQAQADLAVLRARDAVVRTRVLLINHVRGACKAVGARLPACSTPTFAKRVASQIPRELVPALTPLLTTIAELTQQLRAYDREVLAIAAARYPETQWLRSVPGVGPLTALCYVLTLEEPHRFATSRAVGAYLGLCPREWASGNRRAQLRITKAGDRMMRRLLVTAANYILGPFGPDTALRRWGVALVGRGGAHAKHRAVVAVARKLACLLHSLWRHGTAYDPGVAAAAA